MSRTITSLARMSSEEEEERIGDNRKEKGVHEGGVQLEIEERIFEPKWKSDAGGYLRGVRGFDPSATKKREKGRKKELEKSASQSRPIVDMFSAQHNQNRLHHLAPPSDPFLLPENSSDTVMKKVV